MRYMLLLLVAGIMYINWDVISRELSPRAALSAEQSQGVVLYATSWCSYCQKTREFFAQHQIPYREYDVENSSDGRAQYDQLRGKGVPLVLIEGQVLRGYNPAKMKQLLNLP